MQHRSNRKHTKAFTFLLSLGMLASVLIWAKLRLIEDIPRSALADPKEHELIPEASDQETQGEPLFTPVNTSDRTDEQIETEDTVESGLDIELEQEALSDP